MKIVIVLCLMLAVGFGNVAYSEVPSKEVDRLISMLSDQDKEVKKMQSGNLGTSKTKRPWRH